MVNVIVNGQNYELDSDSRLPDLFQQLGLQSKWTLVERNGEPVNRTDYDETPVLDGDRFEIATPMAGG